MNQSFFYNKQENMDNARKVVDFYHEVLKEFTNKLDKEFRYKGIITAQQIEKMELTVNQRLGQPAVLFDKILSMKEGTKTEADIKNQTAAINQFPELKQQYDEENNEYLRGQEIKGKSKDSDEDDFDDVDDFYKHINKDENFGFKSVRSDQEVKKEDQSGYTQKKPVAESQKEIKQEQDSHEQTEQLSIEECLQNLNSIILSTFSAPTLKHKPKQQKILVTLDNTFLKSLYNQFYIGSVNVDVSKIEKSDIRKEFPKKSK